MIMREIQVEDLCERVTEMSFILTSAAAGAVLFKVDVARRELQREVAINPDMGVMI
jgi:hypothetical protein